uniref:Uncharacterized protein n=1 Tax=Helianthus annuus TaxID=4232 RepID=A0A251SPW2_HELAN
MKTLLVCSVIETNESPFRKRNPRRDFSPLTTTGEEPTTRRISSNCTHTLELGFQSSIDNDL